LAFHPSAVSADHEVTAVVSASTQARAARKRARHSSALIGLFGFGLDHG
jgi:hypothetical protein